MAGDFAAIWRDGGATGELLVRRIIELKKKVDEFIKLAADFTKVGKGIPHPVFVGMRAALRAGLDDLAKRREKTR